MSINVIKMVVSGYHDVDVGYDDEGIHNLNMNRIFEAWPVPISISYLRIRIVALRWTFILLFSDFIQFLNFSKPQDF